MKYKLRRLEWGIKGLIYLVYAFLGFGGGNNWGSCLDLGFQLWLVKLFILNLWKFTKYVNMSVIVKINIIQTILKLTLTLTKNSKPNPNTKPNLNPKP